MCDCFRATVATQLVVAALLAGEQVPPADVLKTDDIDRLMPRASNAAWSRWPLLTSHDDSEDVWLLTPKFDGHLVVWNGEQLCSKKGGIEWTSHMPDALKSQLPPQWPFVGELCVGTHACPMVASLRTGPGHVGWNHARIVIFYVFCGAREPCSPLHERLDNAELFLQRWNRLRRVENDPPLLHVVAPRLLTQSRLPFGGFFTHVVDDLSLEGVVGWNVRRCPGKGRQRKSWKARAVLVDSCVVRNNVVGSAGHLNARVLWTNQNGEQVAVDIRGAGARSQRRAGDSAWLLFRGTYRGSPHHPSLYPGDNPLAAEVARWLRQGLPAVFHPYGDFCNWSAHRLINQPAIVFDPRRPPLALVAPPGSDWCGIAEAGPHLVARNGREMQMLRALVESQMLDIHLPSRIGARLDTLIFVLCAAAVSLIGFDSTLPSDNRIDYEGYTGMVNRLYNIGAEDDFVCMVALTMVESVHIAVAPFVLRKAPSAVVKWDDPTDPFVLALSVAIAHAISDWHPLSVERPFVNLVMETGLLPLLGGGVPRRVVANPSGGRLAAMLRSHQNNFVTSLPHVVPQFDTEKLKYMRIDSRTLRPAVPLHEVEIIHAVPHRRERAAEPPRQVFGWDSWFVDAQGASIMATEPTVAHKHSAIFRLLSQLT